jgi:hypothetical protein
VSKRQPEAQEPSLEPETLTQTPPCLNPKEQGGGEQKQEEGKMPTSSSAVYHRSPELYEHEASEERRASCQIVHGRTEKGTADPSHNSLD